MRLQNIKNNLFGVNYGYKAIIIKKHYEWQGKIEGASRTPVADSNALSLAYTPGVAESCLKIKEDINKSYELTRRSNLVAVITDGSAAVVGTGRSDFANQINNVLAFPGIFRGALDVRASDINEEMLTAAYMP